MASNPGNFTPALLQKTVAKMDELWADNQTVNDYVPEVGVLTAIRAEQTAKLSVIENPEKDKVLKIIWAADCGGEVEDCTDGEADQFCDWTGPQAEARSKDYALDECSTIPFTIEESVFYTSELNQQEVLAVQMLNAMKKLDEHLAQKTVAKLNSFAGVNQYEGGIGVVDGSVTYIAPNYWTPSMYGYFALVAKKNKLNNPFLIHGTNLYQTMWETEFLNLNQNQKDLKPKLGSMRTYWDIWNIDLVNEEIKRSYMIAKGAVAFANKARYPKNNPKEYQFGKRWSVQSKALPGVWYDVFYKESCGEGEKVFYDFKMRATYGIYLNPFGCNDDVTGVLLFDCGTGPIESN